MKNLNLFLLRTFYRKNNKKKMEAFREEVVGTGSCSFAEVQSSEDAAEACVV